MDLETFAWLLTPHGQSLLELAMAGDLSERGQLAGLTTLRRHATAEQAAAAYQTAVLRRRAATKFSRAHAMYFTREALEQSTSEVISHYRAERYRHFEHVADLACGIGGDALGLGQVTHVRAVDLDPLRLAMAEANMQVYGLENRVAFMHADLQQNQLPKADAIFFDPARRQNGRRVFKLEAYSPPLTLLEYWRSQTQAIGVKIAPGVTDDELDAIRADEVEFISVDGELKEAVLWFGPLATAEKRATVLVQGSRLNSEVRSQKSESGYAALTMVGDKLRREVRLAEPQSYLYEPDPAVIRAHLVADLAQQLAAAQFDSSIAYLTADEMKPTPFARAWRVLEWLPFNLKRLRARLLELDAGAVTVKKRGSPLDTDVLARQLSGRGTRPLVVVLTKLRGQAVALVCEGPV